MKLLHTVPYIPDYFSDQGWITVPMTVVAIQLSMMGMSSPGRRHSTPTEFREQFIARTKKARLKKYDDFESIAKALSHSAGRRIVADTYRKWEKQGKGGALLPHDLIIPFCELTETDPWALLTGSPFDLAIYMASMRRKSAA